MLPIEGLGDQRDNSRAPSAEVRANSASADRKATVCGFGLCAAARSKKPFENARTPSGPSGCIEKYFE